MMNGITSQPPLGPLGSTLSIDEAAAVLAIPAEGVLRYIRTGELPHLRMPGGDAVEVRVLPDDVYALRTRLALHKPSEPDLSAEPAGAHPNGSAGTADSDETDRVESPAGLPAEHDRLLAENIRLRDDIRARSDRIAELESMVDRSRSSDPPAEVGPPPWLDQLRLLPAAMEELSARIQALQEELTWLRERREQTDEGAFQQAWRRIQRRPWWADLLD
ncbi:MAG: hypothetical protein ACRDIE_13105 [Chloroflexota bacterium]